ncbi:transposase [Ruminiclostridium herbifermentans]|uniref:Transposase n=1 Tax=Ruminiclostridium herbifermentans TaxID=2488810 RepID=A0A7H1VQ57_9FIRM|nr:transposase [Ruminiclostridium herbifermentans]
MTYNPYTPPYSNRLTEGINNTIRFINRIAYGCLSYDNLRLKILQTLQMCKEPITRQSDQPFKISVILLPNY